MALEEQAALETAVVNLMRAATADSGLAYTTLNCGRMFDGRPPAVARGRWYAAVWGDNSGARSENNAMRTALDEAYTVYVTITVEMVLPFDRWVEHRDFLEAREHEIKAMIHRDIYNNIVTNAANVLAGFRRADLAAGATKNVGFYRGLSYESSDPVQAVGAAWLNADPDSGREAVTQRLRFGGALRTQNLANME